jgi:hypothetical protein
MNDMLIPPHIDMTRRIAADLAATVTRLTVTEQQLKQQLDEHQRDAAAERDRIEAELRAAREKAEAHLAALAETERRLTGELTGVGRQLQQHRDEAEQAQQSIADWCTRRAIDPSTLPPLPDTGPLLAIPAPEPQTRKPLLRELTQEAVEAGTYGEPAPGMEPKLPSLEVSDAVLEAGRRAADPGATRVDAGGDGPAEGPFPGDVESPAGPRPKRPRRRPQSDRVNSEQDGDDRG